MPESERREEASESPTPVLGKITLSDGAVALVGAALSTVPVVGGPLAAIAAEFRRAMDRRQAERLAEVIDDLQKTVESMREYVYRDLTGDEPLVRFLEAALESASEARHAEKRRFYVALVARSATHDGPEAIERGILLDTLDRVQETHLRLLYAIAAAPRPEKASDYARLGSPASDALRTALPGLDVVLLHRAWEDLVSLGLLVSWTDSLVTEDSPVDIVGDGPITRFGAKFLGFVAPF